MHFYFDKENFSIPYIYSIEEPKLIEKKAILIVNFFGCSYIAIYYAIFKISKVK